MLSGIRTGKKKKTPRTNSESEEASAPPRTSNSTSATSDNLSVADRLRQSLATGSGDLPATPYKSLLDQLEQRGRIESSVITTKSQDNNIVVQLPTGRATTATNKKEDDMTIQELVANERRQNQDMSWDEQMTRNMARMDKNRKRKLKTNDDSDEEVERMKKWLPGATNANEGTAKAGRAIEKGQQRDRHRLMHEKMQEDKVTAKCSWWIESSSFRKHRLLALGNHISLVMAPPNASLIAGNHFYIVPLKHTPSFVCGEGDAWSEVLRFQTSLQNLYARQGKSVIMLETVLEHSKGLWQTKLEVIPVPFGTIQDSPMYFSSSMKEQTEEWGTHNKLMKVSTEKPLRSVVPNGFPYFYVDWGRIATSPSVTGYCQIIESESFRSDFGVDTVAAMLDLDPIRLNRKKSYSHEEERQQITDFLKLWEKVDWTTELDSTA